MGIFRKQVIQNHSTSRTFDYTKGETQLKFTLSIDEKNQLRDFKELLEKALADVTEEIERKTP